jgi:ABC-type amino acid transport substrate-binding protein
MTVVQASENPECLQFHVIKSSPLGFINSEKINVGVHWEYLTAIEEETGLCINKLLLPYARIWQSIKHGKHDGGIIFKSDSRSSMVEYIAPIRTVITAVIPVNSIDIKSYSDLHGLLIGKTRGSHLSKKFDQDTEIDTVELNDYDQAAEMIKYGRIDAIAGSALVLSYQLQKHKVLDKVSPEKKIVIGEKEQWFQLSKKSKHHDKIPKLKKAIIKLQQNGTFDRIMDKYYGVHWRTMNH